jgi:hypothetical protein
VARSPETILRGSSNIRAPEAAGGGCWASAFSPNALATRKTKEIVGPRRRKDMGEIVVENFPA